MQRQFSWIVPVVVVTTLVSYFYIWPWYRDRENSVAIDALFADLSKSTDEIKMSIDSMSDTPESKNLDRLSELNQATRPLIERMREAIPKSKGDQRQRLLDAQSQYQKQTLRIGEKIGELQRKLDEKKKG